jgi:hypothetical protein
MNVMLGALFASIAVGLLESKVGAREKRIIYGIATLMVIVYLAHPGFMT